MIDVFVDELVLSELGFAVALAEMGPTVYHPVKLLKFYV